MACGSISLAQALPRGAGTLTCLILALANPDLARAQELPAISAEPSAPWREVWAGADVGANVWLLYTGTTLSPYSGIHDEGLKLRVLSGYGGYSYEGFRRGPGNVPALRSFDAETAFTDVLAGYLFWVGPLTAKAFAGVSAINHTIRPFDPQNEVQGLDWGAKGVVELWLDVTPEWWASLDTSVTTAHETFAARARTGYRLQPDLSTGLWTCDCRLWTGL